jgi:CPA2 family monovalent cation:H+ antiporter-2
MVVGPYTPPVNLVSNLDSINTLSQLGLIFLMFSTGLGLSFRKLSRLGLALFAAVLCSTLVIITLMRIGGALLQTSVMTSLFIAGMLSSSSSAIISRILHEGGFIHRHSGQLAMTITLLEDLAALILFSVVGSYAAAAHTPLVHQTGAFFAFLVLVIILALLWVPRFLASIQHRLQEELRTLLVAGTLCLLSVLANHAGYSPALGAFLFGVIIAGTPQRAAIERTFNGLRDIFSAVFFVSIGMLIDVHIFLSLRLLFWLVVLAIGAIAVRLIASTTGMLLAGYKERDAFPAALTLTVTGEFSSIFAQLGVSRGILPKSAHALVVGVCLVTTAFATFAVRRSDRITPFLIAHQPRLLTRAISGWQNILATMGRRGQASTTWRFARKRVWQVGVEILFVTGLLVFAEPLFVWVFNRLGHDPADSLRINMIFWSVFGIFLLGPLVAIWRNINALAIIYSQAATPEEFKNSYRPALLENLIKLIAAVALAGWLWLFWPANFASIWIPVILAGVLGIMAILFWRKMTYWHSIMEGHIYRALQGEEYAQARAWRNKTAEWNVTIGESTIPDYSPHGGRTIADLNIRAQFRCTIIAIDRQGYLLMNPASATTIYPQDRLLLLGAADRIAAAQEWLMGGQSPTPDDAGMDDIHFETIHVPKDSPRLGQTLMHLGIAGQLGVQIAGIRRNGVEHINPPAGEMLQAGDELLTLGLPHQIRAFNKWLADD